MGKGTAIALVHKLSCLGTARLHEFIGLARPGTFLQSASTLNGTISIRQDD